VVDIDSLQGLRPNGGPLQVLIENGQYISVGERSMWTPDCFLRVVLITTLAVSVSTNVVVGPSTSHSVVVPHHWKTNVRSNLPVENAVCEHHVGGNDHRALTFGNNDDQFIDS